jgi:hypothetical protein
LWVNDRDTPHRVLATSPLTVLFRFSWVEQVKIRQFEGSFQRKRIIGGLITANCGNFEKMRQGFVLWGFYFE